jgi:diacylglycerol kinase (ATP)
MTAAHHRPRTWLVVANPTAGGASMELIGRVVKLCRSGGGAVQTRLTGGPGDGTRLVIEALAGARDGDRPDVVVAVGGAGTAREVAEGLARASGRWDGDSPAHPAPALLTVPAGTGNSFHRALWADRPWTAVLRAYAGNGSAADQAPHAVGVRRLDLIRAVGDGRAVLLGASSGLIAQVTATAAELKSVPGRERYHRAIAAVLADVRPYPGRVLLDGVPVHEGLTTTVTIGGARHRVGTFEVLPLSVLDDGLLDVCVVDGSLSPHERADLARRIMAGRHVGHPRVGYGQGRRVTIERGDGHGLCLEHDGEVWATAPAALTLEIVPGAVPVVAPARPVAG